MVAVLTLAWAIGANALVFCVLNALTLRSNEAVFTGGADVFVCLFQSWAIFYTFLSL
jgi:hypothetical protein